MNKFNSTKYLIYFIAVLGLANILPWLWGIGTDKAIRYPFTYYSSVNRSFCYIDTEGETLERKDVHGHSYADAEFDRVLPMFYYRQLAIDGKLPDTLNGVALTTQKIKQHSFFFRYKPRNLFSPKIPLHTLFESQSGKVDLEMPGDMFRFGNNGIDFIDPITNKVNSAKSDKYSQVLKTMKFAGPPQIVAGTPSPRKPYDEGYFMVDRENMLFHLKQVNGKPFVKKTALPDGLELVHISSTEYPDRRFYGFAIDSQSNLYYISTDNYKLVSVPLPEFSFETDQLIIMGNMFYWNVGSTTRNGKTIYALDANSIEVVDSVSYDKKINSSDEVRSYLFPATLTFTSYHTNYVRPAVTFSGFNFLYINALLAVLYVLYTRIRKQKLSFVALAGTGLAGIYGFIPALVINLSQ